MEAWTLDSGGTVRASINNEEFYTPSALAVPRLTVTAVK